MPKRELQLSHRIAIGLWHAFWTFLIFFIVMLFLDYSLNSTWATIFLVIPSVISFVLGFCNKQSPIMSLYDFALGWIR